MKCPERQVAVVTAAGQGIGRALAERLVAEAAIVHASDPDPGQLADLGGADTAGLDASDRDAVNARLAGLGRIDALVHAVGYVHSGTIEGCGPDDWRRSIEVGLISTFHVIDGPVTAMEGPAAASSRSPPS